MAWSDQDSGAGLGMSGWPGVAILLSPDSIKKSMGEMGGNNLGDFLFVLIFLIICYCILGF